MKEKKMISMGVAIAVAATITMILLVVVVSWKVLKWVWLRPKKLEKLLRKQGFKGNSYSFLWGDSKQNVSMLMETRSKPISFSNDISARASPLLSKLLHQYGKNFFVWIGPTPRVIVLNPEMIKEVLNKNFKYQKPPLHPLFKFFASGLPSLEGDKWMQHRRLLNPAFHTEKLKGMLPAFDLCCHEMTMKWNDMIGDSPNSREIDVWPFLQTLTSHVISRTAFGSSYEAGKKVFELQVEQADLAFMTLQLVYIPGSRFLPTKKNKRMKEIDREVRFLLKGIIDNKLKAMKSGEGGTHDLLEILLEANSKEVEHGNKNVAMSIDDVMEECKVFYIAGQETTSTLLVWTMVLLSIHPDWQEQARQEVIKVIGDAKPDVDHLGRLKIMTMILYEVLRLYPAVAGLVRSIYEEITLGDITLQPGMQVFLPINLIHHDPDIWGADVNDFNPGRFSEGVSKATKNQVAAFFPFGGGPRICIGQNFAILEAKLAMVMILRKFSFELSPSYTHAPVSKFTLQPGYGASLILHKL